MKNETFEIRFRKDYDKRVYKAIVEITHHSYNLMRFTIKASEKEMEMEKHLYRKTNQWKLGRMNFQMKEATPTTAKLILEIQKAIDYQLKVRLSGNYI